MGIPAAVVKQRFLGLDLIRTDLVLLDTDNIGAEVGLEHHALGRRHTRGIKLQKRHRTARGGVQKEHLSH